MTGKGPSEALLVKQLFPLLQSFLSKLCARNVGLGKLFNPIVRLTCNDDGTRTRKIPPLFFTAEIVIAGEIPSPDVESREEGPIGEWTGYFTSGSRPEPVIRVKALYHRNEPIILGMPPKKY